MIYFISFATDEKYKKLSIDVLGDLNKIYPNSELKIFSKEDLTPEVVEYCERYELVYVGGIEYFLEIWSVLISFGILIPSIDNDSTKARSFAEKK